VQELVDVLLAAELDEHYGVALDFIALLHENATLANTLLQAPQSMLEVLEDALITAQASPLLLIKPSKCSAAALHSGEKQDSSGTTVSCSQPGTSVSTHPAGADVHQLLTPCTCQHISVTLFHILSRR
jgi:hypothetical protein